MCWCVLLFYVGVGVGFLCGVTKCSGSGSSCSGGCVLRGEAVDCASVVSVVVFRVLGGMTLKIPHEFPLPKSS